MIPAVDDRGSRTTMEEDGAGRRRQFITPWKKAEQGGGSVGWSSDVVAPFPPPPRMSPLISLASTNGSRSHAKDRLARLAAAATWVSVVSSSTTLSPRVTQGESNVQIGQRSKKRKSPCVRMPIFPLSRMLLSPKQLPRISLRSPRSPSVKRRISPCSQRGMLHIDLNVELEEDNAETWFVLDAGPVTQENTMTCFNPDVGPIAQENTMSCFDLDVGVVAQENAEIWFVPDAGLVIQENTITCFSPDVGPVAQENIVSCFDPDVGAIAQENVETWFNPDVGVVAQENTHRNVVSNDKRRAIFDAVLAKARNGNLKGHETTQVSAEFSVPIRTVQRIWKKGKSCLDQGIPVDVTSEKSRCGRKKIEVDMSTLKDIPMSSRTTIQDVAAHFRVSKSKIHKMKKEGAIKRVSNAMKPYLTQQNKIDRLKWCLSMLGPRSVPQDPVFKTLFDFVFIDEKWYNITRKTERYYTAPNDEQPIRTCKNKNYIPKIMILTALARPRFDFSGNCTFDGKIGCFPFVTYTAAKRSSVKRPAGTMEMKPIESITKDVIRNCLIEKVLPAIRAKWPHEDTNKPIYI